MLVSRRKRYVATDIDREHLRRLGARLSGRHNLEIAQLDASRVEDYSLFRAQMDTVVCVNVLEHIEDDLAALRNIYATLLDGGRAIVLVPEGQGICGSLDVELGHCRRYSEELLRHRMVEAGFSVEAMLRFNRISRPGWWVNGKILKRRTISRFQLRTFDRLVWLFRRIDAYLPWSPTSIIAIGRKPPAEPGSIAANDFDAYAKAVAGTTAIPNLAHDE